MPEEQTQDTRFSGRWIGATQGCDMPAHVWEITQRGRSLTIETRWEDARRATRMYGEVLVDAPGFSLGEQFIAMLVDPQHFIIPGWDTNDARGGAGPSYDVVFSRPGIAELMAEAVWLKHREALAAASIVTSVGETAE
jgi:hypothetical protein